MVGALRRFFAGSGYSPFLLTKHAEEMSLFSVKKDTRPIFTLFSGFLLCDANATVSASWPVGCDWMTLERLATASTALGDGQTPHCSARRAPPCLSERTAEPGGEPPARASQPRARRGKASLLLLPVDFLMHGRSRLDLLAGKKLRREK